MTNYENRYKFEQYVSAALGIGTTALTVYASAKGEYAFSAIMGILSVKSPFMIHYSKKELEHVREIKNIESRIRRTIDETK